VHRVEGVSLIGLNSALPTAPLLARGRLGRAQLARLADLLAAEQASGQTRIVMLHHPPAADAIGWRKALADREDLCAVLRRHGAELVLHGHARDARLDAVAGPHGAIPCLCVPSSSALPNPSDQGAMWHRLSLRDGAADGAPSLHVEVRRWSVEGQAFVADGGFALALPRAGHFGSGENRNDL
jgi:3',5'-cyclic AMP phosphodiesterase CpdA